MPDLTETYMGMAILMAKNSKAVRAKVGAVAVKDHRVLSVGYNGPPPGYDNNCEIEVDGELMTRPEVIHAEQNAIYKMARDGQSALGADLFITHAPCVECAKAIKTSGFRKVWYRDEYRSQEGLQFLEELGVEVEKV